MNSLVDTIKRNKVIKSINFSLLGSLLGLIILVVSATVFTQGAFLRGINIVNLFRQVTIIGFASLGMTIVILTGNIDLSIIGNVSMTNVLTAVLMQQGLPFPTIILFVCLAGASIGLVNSVILNIWKIESFVVTMGMQVVCFGLALWISGSRTVIVDSVLLDEKYTFLKILATHKIAGIPMMFLILLAFFGIFAIFMQKSRMGRYIYALGGNEEVSYISGVNVSIVRSTAYILSGFCAAIAGIFMYSRSLCGDPAAGNALGMYVVAAVVVGGTKMSGGRGNVLFTIIGIFIIQVINNTLNLLRAPYEIQQVVQGIIILVSVILSSKRRR